MGDCDSERKLIADFAAGEGDLLRVAEAKWPNAEIVAADIDSATAKRLRRKNAGWSIGVANFLDAESRSRSRVLRRVKGKVDLLLLNPPFSCRGGKKVSVEVEDQNLDCSIAMAFVLLGIEYLRKGGEIRAVLPAGSVSSQKDAAARSYLRGRFLVSIGTRFDQNTFNGCFPKTVLLRVALVDSSCKNCSGEINGRAQSLGLQSVRIYRGGVQMHSALESDGEDSLPLIHTTNLKNDLEWELLPRIQEGRGEITGPAVLLPRVGRPTQDKVVLLSGSARIALSDCIFALKCDSTEDLKGVYDTVKREWTKVKAGFGGTGAPYLTLGKLADALGHMGIHVEKPEGVTPQYARSLDHREG